MAEKVEKKGAGQAKVEKTKTEKPKASPQKSDKPNFNTVALGTAQGVFVSQHIGDLETATALDAFRRVVQDLPRLLRRAPEELATDLHPDYLSSKEAARMGLPRHAVQHHFAHVLACLAENELDGPVLGLAWDGTGYGLDGTIWGGKFLVAERGGFQRFAALRPFPLPGGDQAMRELLRIDPDVKAIVSSGYSADPILSSHKEHGLAGAAGAEFPVAGTQPYARPVGAPTITAVTREGWYQRALHGVSQPIPPSLRWLDSQGNWYTPFTRPGMPPPYDIRGWHAAPAGR